MKKKTQHKPVECKDGHTVHVNNPGLCLKCGWHQPTQPVEEWETKYTMMHGDLGVYFISHEDVREGIHNPIDIKSFIRSLLSAKEAEVRRKTIELVESHTHRYTEREQMMQLSSDRLLMQEHNKKLDQLLEELKHVKG